MRTNYEALEALQKLLKNVWTNLAQTIKSAGLSRWKYSDLLVHSAFSWSKLIKNEIMNHVKCEIKCLITFEPLNLKSSNSQSWVRLSLPAFTYHFIICMFQISESRLQVWGIRTYEAEWAFSLDTQQDYNLSSTRRFSRQNCDLILSRSHGTS